MDCPDGICEHAYNEAQAPCQRIKLASKVLLQILQQL